MCCLYSYTIFVLITFNQLIIIFNTLFNVPRDLMANAFTNKDKKILVLQILWENICYHSYMNSCHMSYSNHQLHNQITMVVVEQSFSCKSPSQVQCQTGPKSKTLWRHHAKFKLMNALHWPISPFIFQAWNYLHEISHLLMLWFLSCHGIDRFDAFRS